MVYLDFSFYINVLSVTSVKWLSGRESFAALNSAVVNEVILPLLNKIVSVKKDSFLFFTHCPQPSFLNDL